MTLDADGLELECPNGDYGLSARRLWEHTELGQINVHGQDVSSRKELNDAEAFIDIVSFSGDTFSQNGFTLAELRADRMCAQADLQNALIDLAEIFDKNIGINRIPEPKKRPLPLFTSVPPGFENSSEVRAFVRMVAAHLDRCSIRQALRNQHQPFLPSAQANDIFGVPFLFSTLQRRLQAMGNSKSVGSQWTKTIENFRQKGLRIEELEASNLALRLETLEGVGGKGQSVSALDLANLCNFNELRLSVIPVVKDAQRPMHFGKPPDRKLRRTKNVPRAVASLPRELTNFDRVLGYRIERVDHQSLWGPEHTWQAVTHEGKIIQNQAGINGFQTATAAANVAASHAQQHFPKRVALGRWNHWAWTGGEDYREWLITLPRYPSNYLGNHFDVRNVLAHVRCDVREDGDGERVMFLHEVQSDWAQSARRAISTGEMDEFDDDRPPFLKEWPSLTMKLILLHAAHQGLDAVAWTRGVHQVTRYKGLGANGLIELYDRTLPRAVNRMMKPLGAVVEMLGVFVPTNFSIRQTEYGYEVYSVDDELLGTALTLEETRQFVPDRGHELLNDVHGVRLTDQLRAAIFKNGFPAWG